MPWQQPWLQQSKGETEEKGRLHSSPSVTSMDRSADSMEFSGDLGVGSFFSSDYKRHDDLKQMLDSNRDHMKLEAMKRIIGMVAKGRDASELFPAVVKNVVSKNPEVKKLVYVYLVRYAEEQQDLALLSISTFQRALKDPNQLIRGSALRVLSSIRVPMIAPIVMLAIRDASSDMSPYVRKTAAHAIPKLCSLDPSQKEELLSILEKLLADRTTLVVGSAMMAFEEICPERVDLIHKNYRKLCTLLMDIDEWGQVVILNVLTRYARCQFLNPNILDGDNEEDKPFYDDEDDDENDERGDESSKRQEMDPDHRLLLKNAKPLLQSRNSAVVMAVAQLYYHAAPKSEVTVVIKALIRLLRYHPEVQVIVLTAIAAMSTERQSLFEPYMKSFFVRSSDPTQIKSLKLEILTNIANETNIPPILREFQTYISGHDKEFVAATIKAIGRCASNIKDVAQTCLNGLVSLLSHRDPAVVGGAVVVTKTLLQSQKSGVKPVIVQLSKMVDRVSVAPARAAILWLLGEHCERLPHLPPDVLRKMAKTFPDEEDIVKLQIINLSAKLQITNPIQTTLLVQYVLNLAKYDQSYDIRDRARFIRQILFPENENSKLTKYAKRILLSSKPAPVLQSKFKDRDNFQLGSLSHFLNTRCSGYQDLPEFPEEAPDPSVRHVEEPSPVRSGAFSPTGSSGLFENLDKLSSDKGKSFYSSEDEASSSESESNASSSSSSGSETEEESSVESDEEDSCAKKNSKGEKVTLVNEAKRKSKNEENSVEARNKRLAEENKRKVIKYCADDDSDDDDDDSLSNESDTEDSDSSRSSSSSPVSSSSEEPSSADEVGMGKAAGANRNNLNEGRHKEKKLKEKGPNVDTLLDLGGEDSHVGNASNQSNISFHKTDGQILKADKIDSTTSKSPTVRTYEVVPDPMYVEKEMVEVLNKIVSGGLQITFRFSRAVDFSGTNFVPVELRLSNLGKDTIKELKICEKHLSIGMDIQEFPPVPNLQSGESRSVSLGINFNDTTQGAKLDLSWMIPDKGKREHSITIKATVGELLRPIHISEADFLSEQGKLKGMNEHEGKVAVGKHSALFNDATTSKDNLVRRVIQIANVLQVSSCKDDTLRLAGVSISSGVVVLVTLMLDRAQGEEAKVEEIKMVVNCEKIVLGSILLQELKEAFK